MTTYLSQSDKTLLLDAEAKNYSMPLSVKDLHRILQATEIDSEKLLKQLHTQDAVKFTYNKVVYTLRDNVDFFTGEE